MNVAGRITVDIRDLIAVDQNVFDNNSNKVGTVDTVDLATGWLTIEANPYSERELYVPFSLVTYIDPHELFLGASKDELSHNYATPPERVTAVQGEGASQSATTTQQSGYDGAPMVVNAARLDELRKQISTGYEVYTSDMVDLGKVREYDATTGLMVLDKGAFSHDVVVPISVVDEVDAAMNQVILVASEADLKRVTTVNLVRTAASLAGSN